MTTPTTIKVQLQLRQDTAANWTSVNPVLLAGELGRESDTGNIKIGDGTTAWSSLAYQPFGGDNLDLPGTLDVTGAATFDSTVSVDSDLTLNAQADLRFADSDSSNWVAFQAPGTIASNVTWTLPDADATVAGHALKSDGSGNLSWGTAGGATGGGTDDVFYENSQTVTTNYTLTSNKNAMTAGPVTVNSGVTVTIPTGSNWVVV